MSATTESNGKAMASLRQRMHPKCFLCGAEQPQGLHLNFSVQDDERVEATFTCPRSYQGYTGHLHGGVISALLDSAMTNCLFSLGHIAMTGELKVRFLKPVDVDSSATVTAWVDKSHGPLFFMRGEFVQGGKLKAHASAKFMKVTDETAIVNTPT